MKDKFITICPNCNSKDVRIVSSWKEEKDRLGFFTGVILTTYFFLCKECESEEEIKINESFESY